MFKKIFQLVLQKKKMPAKLRDKAQGIVYKILKKNFFEQIPLQEIREGLKSVNISLLQEDDTEWSGFLLGDKECGDPAASNQRAKITLGFEDGGVKYKSDNCLIIMWCRMPSGKKEVTGYIS